MLGKHRQRSQMADPKTLEPPKLMDTGRKLYASNLYGNQTKPHPSLTPGTHRFVRFKKTPKPQLGEALI